jgi:glycosyltransferase involved in cell wall biosynthesis
MVQSKIIRALAILQASSITGVAKSVLEFAREATLSRSGQPTVDLSIVLLSRSQEENNFTAAMQHANIAFNVLLERRKFDWRTIAELQALIESKRPDIIWSNSVKSHFLVRLARLNRSARWVAFHHGYAATDRTTQFSNQLDRWSLRAADRVLTVCQPFAEELESRGVRANHIRVQHMPVRPFGVVDSDRKDKLRAQLGIAESTMVVLSVGRLSKEKGHEDLIRAFRTFLRQTPNISARLVLVGDGPERSRLMSLCERFKLGEDVMLVGHQDDVSPYYSVADLFVLPSHIEGSPMALLEAMAAGVPVIATDAGGVSELASHEMDALLVRKHDIAALSGAISRMLENADLRERLRSSARKVVLLHTPSEYYRSVVSVFDEALSA